MTLRGDAMEPDGPEPRLIANYRPQTFNFGLSYMLMQWAIPVNKGTPQWRK